MSTRAATPEERRARYLAAQSRYNSSPKGRRRNQAYEERTQRGFRLGAAPHTREYK